MKGILTLRDFLDVDMRSAASGALTSVEKRFRAIVRGAAEDEDRAHSTRLGRVTVDRQPIGDRPAGTTPKEATLARLTDAAILQIDYTPHYQSSATDSNIPMSLGVLAVTIGSGGDAGRAHSTAEWIDVAKPAGVKGMNVGLSR